jgi:uncharacterized protein (TIGR04255 family)
LTPIRPKFSNPPLVERAVTVVFEKVNLSIGDYGLFWSSCLDEFPISEAAAPLAVEIERFDGFRPSQTKIEFVDAGTLPRALFRNPAKGELLQLQNDRFSFNWVKTSDDHTYPHSEAVLSRFFEFFKGFAEFAKSRGLGTLIPVQCEITNVNAISLSDVGDSFVDFGTVVRLPDVSFSDPFLTLESQVSGAKYLIIGEDGRPIGRVHSIGQPGIQATTQELVYRFDITARGAPIGDGIGGIEAFFDSAVSAVNGVFLASITQSGRRFWGELDG